MITVIKQIFDKFWIYSDNFSFIKLKYKKINPFEYEKHSFDYKELNETFGRYNKKWGFEESVRLLKKKIIIEPDYMYCITDFNIIIQASVFFKALVPSFPRYLLSFFKRKKTYPKVIIFDGQVGTNYFHFFNDILNKIWLIFEIDNYKKIPVLVGHKTYNTKWFKFLIQNKEFASINWIIQSSGTYIKTQEVIFINPMPYSKDYFSRLRNLEIIDTNIVKKSNLKIFLNRTVSSGRYISNFKDIENILLKYNFKIIDTSNMKISEQIRLFSSISFLISIHGAGETNIIFASKGIRFLEILPSNRIACQYYWLAKSLELNYYDAILGGNLPFTNRYPEKGFYLNPQKFENSIIKLLST